MSLRLNVLGYDESHDSESDHNGDDFEEAGLRRGGPTFASYADAGGVNERLRSFLASVLPRVFRSSGYKRLNGSKRQQVPTLRKRRLCTLLNIVLGLGLVYVLITVLFRPSYTRPPKHYGDLQRRAAESDGDGRANPAKQKVFIAASLYDEGGHILRGQWGQAVLQLIDLLGQENVYLSIYENAGDDGSIAAQEELRGKIKCRHSILYDPDFVMEDVPHFELPDGSRRVPRMAFLAAVRNKALDPLGEEAANIKFDKILYLNDVFFRPIDAVQLLFSTNRGEDGKESYRAACAMDFANPFKFYDTFASRDTDGFGMGVIFYPWFSSAGNATSRHDVLQASDAVRVKSCWGGMVAFDARPFRAEQPLRFRASDELYWDASECCLIHADLAAAISIYDNGDLGIYMNPFIRVAYEQSTLDWLPFVQRFERLFAIPQWIVNHLVGLPWHNPRRTEEARSWVDREVWVQNYNFAEGGSYQTMSRKSKGDGFCGRRGLQLLKKDPQEGEKNWEEMAVPG